MAGMMEETATDGPRAVWFPGVDSRFRGNDDRVIGENGVGGNDGGRREWRRQGPEVGAAARPN